MIEPGTLLQNRYRVTRQIGHGGMGAVFVATDERFRSTVAIKQTFFDDPSLRKAFEREAHLLNHLRHAALPKVSDHFLEESGQFLVMEFIEGSDLSELLQQRHGAAFPLADVLRWADELLDALDYLHTHEPPVVHRDIKPQNLKLTTRGQIVLLDFGLAKGLPAQAHTAAHTNASVFGYSRNYAPLEQMQGTGTDPRSDLYSLGATLYHMLTGSAPVDALTRASAVVNNQPDPLRAAHLAHAQVPKAVSDLLQRAMAQNAAHRFATAAEMRAALRLASANTPQPTAARGHSSLLDATVVGTTFAAPEGRARPSNSAAREGRVTSAHLAQPATVMRETTVVDGARRAPRSTRAAAAATDFPATSLYQPPPPPARKSHKFAVLAVVALVVACASVPVLLSRRSAANNKPAAEAQPSPLSPGEFQTDPAQPASGGTTQGLSPNSATAPAETQSTSARPSGDASAAQPAQSTADPNPAADTTATTNDGALNSSPTDAGRSGLVINAPAPASYPTTNDAARAAAAEEEARRAEESRRAQERPALPEGDRRPPPPEGHRPPPPDGRRPPPPHHQRP